MSFEENPMKASVRYVPGGGFVARSDSNHAVVFDWAEQSGGTGSAATPAPCTSVLVVAKLLWMTSVSRIESERARRANGMETRTQGRRDSLGGRPRARHERPSTPYGVCVLG